MTPRRVELTIGQGQYMCVCVCRRNNCEQNVSVIAIIYLPWEIVQQASHRKQPCVDHLVVRPILGMQVHQSLCVEWCPAHEKCYHNGSCNENAIKTYRCVSKKCCWDARRTSSSQWYRMCACHVVSTNTKLTTNYHILLSKGFKRTERGLNWKISFCVCVVRAIVKTTQLARRTVRWRNWKYKWFSSAGRNQRKNRSKKIVIRNSRHVVKNI